LVILLFLQTCYVGSGCIDEQEENEEGDHFDMTRLPENDKIEMARDDDVRRDIENCDAGMTWEFTNRTGHYFISYHTTEKNLDLIIHHGQRSIGFDH
ncbi:hypothetical protein PFISCL1PPCAC_20509, partial [Pristionchus fissidentatus]